MDKQQMIELIRKITLGVLGLTVVAMMIMAHRQGYLF
jgi:hypothetical protein